MIAVDVYMRCRLVGYPVCSVELPHVFSNRHKLPLGNLQLWRRIAEMPVMLTHAKYGGQKKGLVGMMPRTIDFMDERWTFIRARGIYPMTFGAVRVEGLLAAGGKRWSLRYAHDEGA